MPPAIAPVSRTVYRSRAIRSFTAAELQGLTQVAQSRNGHESITGVLLYDDDQFYQWLEGPTDSIGRVMHSIVNDPRHTGLEVLDKKSDDTRRFGNWTMKLAAGRSSLCQWEPDILDPPREVVATLRQSPEAAPSLLLKLMPTTFGVATGGAVMDGRAKPGTASRAALEGRTRAILRDVLLATVIPTLVDLRRAVEPDRPRWEANPRTSELADLLIASDTAAALELIGELRGGNAAFLPLYATLFEPAARRLGDMWAEDSCSEFDVALGLGRLQTAIRLLNTGSAIQPPRRSAMPAALVVPQPGEPHRLGAALDANVMSQAGWTPRCEFPENNAEIGNLLAASWFDALDLSLSTAFRREHWLPRVAQTIAHARRASRNPALAVVVSGRVFMEQSGAGSQVGADLASVTSLGVSHSILRGIGLAGGSVTRAEPEACELRRDG